jgi:hypothetical protein
MATWWVWGAQLETDSMTRYFESVSRTLSEGEADLRRRVEEEQDPEYQEVLADDYLERFDQFPQILRYWHTVAVASTIEVELVNLGKLCGRDVGSDFDAFNASTQGWPMKMAKVHDFIRDECNFQIPANPNWDVLLNAFRIRNAIAHGSGQLHTLNSLNQRASAIAFAHACPTLEAREILLEGAPTGRFQPLRVQDGFVEYLLETWTNWIADLQAAAIAAGFDLP